MAQVAGLEITLAHGFFRGRRIAEVALEQAGRLNFDLSRLPLWQQLARGLVADANARLRPGHGHAAAFQALRQGQVAGLGGENRQHLAGTIQAMQRDTPRTTGLGDFGEIRREGAKAKEAQRWKRLRRLRAFRQAAHHLVAAKAMRHRMACQQGCGLAGFKQCRQDHRRARGERGQGAVQAKSAAQRQQGQQAGAGRMQAVGSHATQGMVHQGALRVHHQLGRLGRARGGEQHHRGVGVRVVRPGIGRTLLPVQWNQRPGQADDKVGHASRRGAAAAQHGHLLQIGHLHGVQVCQDGQKVQPLVGPLRHQQTGATGAQDVGHLFPAVTGVDRRHRGADACGRHQQRQPFNPVHQPDGHPVPGPDTRGTQPGRHALHLLRQRRHRGDALAVHKGRSLRVGRQAGLHQRRKT